MGSKRNVRKENMTRNQGKARVEKGAEKVIRNRQVGDNGAKLIFEDPILCAEFLRGYTEIPFLKDVRPEDIEDISERFLPMFQEGRDSDVVKKVRIRGMELFLIAIVEHQSKVHYDMAFRLLRYIVMVLTDYENEQERLHPGITKTKDFKYPPIRPIVYYEGSETWSAVKNFHERVYLSDVLGEYIPDFRYLVVPLHDYSDAKLIEKGDELSLLMLINKLRNSSEFKKLKDVPVKYLDNLSENTPEYLLHLIGKIIAVLLYRLNVPRDEVEAFTDQIERRKFDMLFDSFEAYDVQETRRVSREEGREEGREEKLVSLICKKMKKGYDVAEIADMLEEKESVVQEICEVVNRLGCDYDLGKIIKELAKSRKEKNIARVM